MPRRPSFPATAASYGPITSSSEGAVRPPSGNNVNSYPQVLDPEHGPQTVHRSDLFFLDNSPHMNTRQNTDFSQRSTSATAPPISNQLYPYHQQAFHHYSPPAPPPPTRDIYAQYQPPPPSYPQNVVANQALVPPLPPKPIVYPPINNTTNYNLYAARPPASLPPPAAFSPPETYPPLPLPPPSPSEDELETTASPTDDSNELAMALALSQSESIKHQKLQEQLRNQEEEDLARALAESMLSTASNVNPSLDPFFPLIPEEITPLPSNDTRTEDTPKTTPASSLPIEHSSPNASSSGRSPNLPPSDKPFPEFGRYEKWRLPGVSDKIENEGQPSNQSQPTNGEFNHSSRKSSINSSSTSPHNLSLTNAPARPLSVSSISSLAYMLPDQNQEPMDGKDGELQHHDAETQDGKDMPESPIAADADPMPKDITAPGAQGRKEDLSLIIPQEILEEPNILVFDDEAYARQLAAEEEALAAQEALYPNEKAHPILVYDKDLGQGLPSYTPENQQHNGVEGPLSSSHPYVERQPTYPSPGSFNGTVSTPLTATTYPSLKHTSQHPEYPQSGPFYGRRLSETNDFKPHPPISTGILPNPPYSPVVYPSLRSRRDTESDTFSEASHQSSDHSAVSAPPAIPSGSQNTSPPFNDARSPASAISLSIPSAGILNANHFLDRELLLGVSIGFKPPPISLTLKPMEDPMPNIISLPYARCPPLHLQAPNWRHLLRLMARLSGTRIEPTVEAMAVTKTDLKLRTVVQFIKPAPHFNDWRTILWFTIDHPVPPSVPGASRYTSSNPNLLPWSYTLSPVPILLRDAIDTNISKTYTIPASDSVPLPNLPIAFPDLARYLQAALDASRQHSGDSSSGLGKLGKTVQMCYPNVAQNSEFDIPERSTVGHLFKRVIGRSNKDKKKGKSNNEETYQLVTPFVPDEWG